MGFTSYDVAPHVDAERTTRELRSIVKRFLPGFELVEVGSLPPGPEGDIRQARPMRSLSGRPWSNEIPSINFPDLASTYYVRTGVDTYRVYVRAAETDDPPKALHISTSKRSILSMQG